MKYKIVFSDRVSESTEEVDFNCDQPELAVKAYANAVINEGTWLKAAVYALPIVVLTSEKTPKPRAEKSTLFRGYTAPATVTVPEKDGFICESSTWIDRVDWDFATGMSVYFLSGSTRVFTVNYADFKEFKDYVEAGGSAGSYYNKHLKGT